MDIPVYSVAGQLVDHVSVDEAALGGSPNMDLVRQAVLMYEANRRLGTHKTQTRGELTATDRKPWHQKHRGRARQGTRNSPIWVGGGVAHGPRPREYRQKMNKAARRRALNSAFLAKASDGEVLVVDELRLPVAKTREMSAILENLGVDRTFLIVLHEPDAELWRCTRNIPGAAMTTYRGLNAREVIRPARVLFTRQAMASFLRDAQAGAARRRSVPPQVGVSEDG